MISEGEIAQRQFGGWAMDFRNDGSKDLFTSAEMANDQYGILTVLADFVKNMR